MEKRIVNILNGDAIHKHLDEAEIKGDRIVWREVLCEGPVSDEVGSTQFWEMRSAFFQTFFNVGHDLFQAKTIDEISRISEIGRYQEVICWFEYDLFCQVNLMALLSFLHQMNLDNTNVFLICAGDEKGYNERVGLGEMQPEEFISLQKNKVKLLPDDLEYADQVWKRYCQNDIEVLQTYVLENNRPCFQYLPDAIEADKKRTRSLPNNLSPLQQSILEAVNEKGFTKRQLLGHLLRSNRDLGLGDSQYEVYLKELDTLIQGEGHLSLSDYGKRVLLYEQKFDH